MEGVPFVGNDACAHNLLLKGRPLIMRSRQLTFTRSEISAASVRQPSGVSKPQPAGTLRDRTNCSQMARVCGVITKILQSGRTARTSFRALIPS